MNEIAAMECDANCRVTVLGHLQRGGTPIAFDRILATQYGVKAFELAKAKHYGRMAAYKNNAIIDVSLEEATAEYNFVDTEIILGKNRPKCRDQFRR